MATYVVAWTVVLNVTATNVTADALDDLLLHLAREDGWVMEHEEQLVIGVWVRGWHYPSSCIGEACQTVTRAALRCGLGDLELRAVYAIRHDLE